MVVDLEQGSTEERHDRGTALLFIIAWSIISLVTLAWTWYPSALIGLILFGAMVSLTFGLFKGDHASFIFGSAIISIAAWFPLFYILGNDLALAFLSVLTLVLCIKDAYRSKVRFPKLTKLSKQRSKALTVLVLGILISYAVWNATASYDGDDLTEFFLLNADGEASDYPSVMLANETAAIILGLNNHQGREVSYEIQVWLTDFYDQSDILNTSVMIYIGNVTVTLPDQPYPQMEEWDAQYMEVYDIHIPIEGKHKLWFILFIDETPSQYQDLKHWEDYYDQGSISLLIDVQMGNYLALALNLEVLP